MMKISAVCEKETVKKAILETYPDVHVYETVLPHVFREEYAKDLKEVLSSDEVVVRTVDELGFLLENSYKGRIIADTYLYTMNSMSEKTLKQMGVTMDTAPLELTYRELQARGVHDSELTVYGRVPLMVSAQCVYRNTHDDVCNKNGTEGHTVFLTDRTKRDLPCICFCRYCYNVIYNSVPISLHNMMEEVISLDPAGLRLYFSTESPKEACAVTGFYRELSDGKNGNDFPVKDYTTGHFRKGVE